MNFLLKYRRVLATLLLCTYFVGATASGELFMTVALKLTTSSSCGGGTCSCNSEGVELDGCCCAGPSQSETSSGGCCSTEAIVEKASSCSMETIEVEDSCCSSEEILIVEEPVEDSCCSSEEPAEIDLASISRMPCDGGGEADDQRFLPKHVLLWTRMVHFHVPFFENQYEQIRNFSFQEFIDLEAPIPIA